ncbi:unnamed protein product, partial [Mesorhabditis spiculigera]
MDLTTIDVWEEIKLHVLRLHGSDRDRRAQLREFRGHIVNITDDDVEVFPPYILTEVPARAGSEGRNYLEWMWHHFDEPDLPRGSYALALVSSDGSLIAPKNVDGFPIYTMDDPFVTYCGTFFGGALGANNVAKAQDKEPPRVQPVAGPEEQKPHTTNTPVEPEDMKPDIKLIPLTKNHT